MSDWTGSSGIPSTAGTPTAADVIAFVRQQTEDAIGPEHTWSDERLLPYVIEAQNRLVYSVRPHLRLAMTNLAPTDITEPSDPLSVPARFVPALALFAASRAFQEDRADSANQVKADKYMAMAMEMMSNG